MLTEFEFNKLTLDDIANYVEKSHVFNNMKETIEAEQIVLASFEDERLGSSQEKLDVAVCREGEWEILDTDKKIQGFTEIPLGYILYGVEYDKVLVILRKMSNMVLDRCKSSITYYMYHVLSDTYKEVEDNLPLYGILAKNRIPVDSIDSLTKRIDGIVDARDRDLVMSWVKHKKE